MAEYDRDQSCLILMHICLGLVGGSSQSSLNVREDLMGASLESGSLARVSLATVYLASGNLATARVATTFWWQGAVWIG